MYPFLRSVVVLVLLAPLAAHSVTLGEARVNSYLNQPLDAEIDLVGLEPGQHEDLRLRIANDEHLERLGIAYDQFLADLRFDVVNSGGRWLVRARSSRPVNEPFLDFAMQMSWPGGQLVKQYTLLLDPPRTIQPARTTRTARTAPARAPQPPSADRVVADSYGPVRSGETLWPIAQKLKPRGITTRQMAIALLRANPQAFIDGNVNRLRAGSVLSIPPRGFIEQLDAEAARAEFARQTERWKTPPIATSPRVVEGETATETVREAPATEAREEVRPAETGKEAAPPEAEAAAQEPEATGPESEDQLRILTEKKGADTEERATEEALKEQLLVTMEEIESNRLTTNAIQEQLSQMEAELERMQKLIELKDAQIAALRSEVTAQAAGESAGDGGPSESGLPLRPDSLGTADSGAEPAPIPAQGQAPVTVAASVPVTSDGAISPALSWQQQYWWVAWVALGLLGLTALMMMFRRPRGLPAAASPIEPVTAQPAAPVAPGLGAAAMTESAALKKAEEDFRRLARERLGNIPDPMESLADLPELEDQPTAGSGWPKPGPVAGARFDTAVEDREEPAGRTAASGPPPGFSDEDIDSWVKELGVELDRTGVDAETTDIDDDIPSILNELDKSFAASDATTRPQPANIELEPIDDLAEAQESADEDVPRLLDELDDQLASADSDSPPPPDAAQRETTDVDYHDEAFSMSLDLARAYLEIDDPEGARDMLQQALASTRDPDHRRQIEELLKQIG